MSSRFEKDLGFDAAASRRIDETQKKIRKVDANSANMTIMKTLYGNKNGNPTLIQNKDIPSNSGIVGKQDPEKLTSKKKRAVQELYQPKRGIYEKIMNSKSSNQGHDLTSNSSLYHKVKTTQNGGKNSSRNKHLENNSQKSQEVIELKNSIRNFSDSRSVHINHKSITVTTKSSKNDVLVSDSSDLSFPDSSGNLSGAYDLPSTIEKNGKNDGILNSVSSEFTSLVSSSDLNGKLKDFTQPSTITKKFSKIGDVLINGPSQVSAHFNTTGRDGNFKSVCDLTQPLTTNKNDKFLFPGVSIPLPDFSSPNINAEFSSMYSFTGSNPLFDSDWQNGFIPPPKPVSCNTCVTSENPENNPYLKKSQFSNLSHLNVEDHFSESPSIHHNKLALHVLDVTSAASSKGNEVKVTDSCEKDRFSESQPAVFSDDQAVDHGIVTEIDQFLQKLLSEKWMPKTIADKILSDLKEFLRCHYDGDSVELYGSYLYDAAISTSNLNLAFVSEYPIKNSFLLYMQKLMAEEMQDYKVFPFEENLKNPRRSKIFFGDNGHGISCELTCLGSTVSKYLELNNMLKAVCAFDHRIKDLVIVVKLWAEACDINEAENGKLHPVGFALLVLHYLQQLDKPLLPLLNVSSKNWGLKELSAKNESSLGELWLDLLKYYGFDFNWNEYVVTVTEKTPVPKPSKSWELSWIAIENPISETNIANSVITQASAEFLTSCFKKSYEYFSSGPHDSDFSSSGSDHSGSQKMRITYRLSDCVAHPAPVFYSDDDSDYEDDYAPKQFIAQELLKFSKISETSLSNVNRVLHEVYDEYKLPNNELRRRQIFMEDIEIYVRKRFPEAKLYLIGSTVNGFAFNRSDLDICMTLNEKDKVNNSESSVLKKLVYHLRRRDDLKNVFSIHRAQVPIIRFNVTHQNWNCDLSLHNILGVHNSQLLYKYSLMDERCQILGFCLKFLAKKTGIADCPTKCLSSYSYILLAIHFLQQVNPPVLPVMPIHDKKVFDEELDEKDLERRGVFQNRNYWYSEDIDQLKKRYLGTERNTLTAGELWLEMLEYYLKFDYERAVSITEKEPVPSSSLDRFACLFNIEDPFLTKKNLGCILSQGMAQETRRIFHRARMLFGCDYPCDKMKNLRDHYFSASNLTGRIMKNIECLGCGAFGHEMKDCLKANPFKNKKQFKPSTNRTQKSYIQNASKL